MKDFSKYIVGQNYLKSELDEDSILDDQLLFKEVDVDTVQFVGYIGDLFEDKSLKVKTQDLTNDIIDYYLCREIRPLEIATDTTLDSLTIDLVSGVGIAAGNYVCIQEGTRSFQAQILNVNVNTITLDTPLDYPFTTAASIAERSPNANLDGDTISQSLKLQPIAGVKWDITRIIITMTHASAADDAKFGGIAALTNGIIIRKSNGIHHTIFNAKNNGDLRVRMYDVNYSDRAGGTGTYGTSTRRSFNGQDKNGVVIRLDGDLNDSLELLIQDDLTGLASFRIVAQGHIVED